MTRAPLTLEADAGGPVSARLEVPAAPRACCVLAHGAGAGMDHRFLVDVAAACAGRGIATLRYNFPFAERGARRVDPPGVAHAVVRAAVAEAARRLPGVPLVAGGKSFGGRMTSQAQALAPLPGVRGLAFLGFPLHPAGKPSTARADHLADVHVPLLFLQGDRDELATLALVESVVATLAPRATLAVYPDADHAFHVRARSGSNDAEVLARMVDRLSTWIDGLGAVDATPAA